ncbi:restriction endonuclease subunit S [Salinicola sp. LHM]|uniref:restriction endonuclease subunit S n=1 Tax=Salinicola sp. LHM TaxID=3065298 RepID=UPI002ACE889A|nr:restriction endonuclease subunit S [Salinicola sp. LHM]WQH34343.1 restriction endonuclease subunit S [Salinicola sp. LHM]
MTFPKYPEYKDSGVEWLGKVPAHWEVAPVRAFVEERTAKNASGGEENYLSLIANVGVIPYAEKGDVGNKKPDDLSKCKRVDIGDLVINSMNYGIGSYGLSGLKGVCSPVYIVLRPVEEKVLPRYALRIFENKEFQKLAQSFGQGILAHRSAIGWDDLKNIKVPLPGADEQAQLSDFLDHETARIDALVEEQQRLIELLKEKRQAVISHAVTKGLDPNVPMKDSGVEWLGEVPVHWEVMKASYIGRLFGSDNVPEDMVSGEGDVPYLKVGSLSADSLEVAGWDWYVDPAISRLYRACSHYVVFPKRGAAIFLNKVNIVSRQALIDPNLMGWEIEGRYSAWYFAYALKLRKLDELADVSTVPQINNKHIGPERFPVPPIEEQEEIVSYLKKRLGSIDELVATSESGVKLLQERRSALISAAVTGKIDVRGWHPPVGSSVPEATQAEAV